MRVTTRLAPPELDPDEWDFRQCEPGELLSATAYEYLRSHPKLSTPLAGWLDSPFQKWWQAIMGILVPYGNAQYGDAFKEWGAITTRKALKRAQTGRKKLQDWGDDMTPDGDGTIRPCLDTFFFDLAATMPGGSHPLREHAILRFWEFPLPWMKLRRKIAPAEMARRCNVFEKPKAVRPYDPRFGVDYGDSNDYFRAEGRPHGAWSRVEVHVDLHRNANDIAKDFNELVAPMLLRPGKNPKGSGRGNKLQLLKWLAAYRLHEAGFGYEAAKARVERQMCDAKNPLEAHGDLLPLYSNSSKWNEAIRKARKLLEDPGSPWVFLNKIAAQLLHL